MKVGIASEWIGENVGGLERCAVSLIRALVRRGGDERYELFLTQRGCDKLAALPGMQVESDGGRRLAPNVHLHATALDSRWYYVPFGLPLQSYRFPVDVLHATFAAVPWCRADKLVLTVHDVCPDVHPEFFPAPLRRRFQWLMRASVARADRVVVPSAASGRELEAHYPRARGKVSVIPWGVDPISDWTGGEGADPAPSELVASPELPPLSEEFVLFVGRFHSRKNLARLIEAMHLMKQRVGEKMALVLVGRDMWEEPRLRKRVAELGLTGEVFFPADVSDAQLATLYRHATVFAYPSIHEGFGFPPLEAMGCGVPVVTSNCSAIPEVVGDAALLVDPLDADALSHALERARSDSALRQQLIAAGRERVKIYTWEKAASATIELYESLSGDKGRGPSNSRSEAA